jgi:hypothetical protein
MSKNKMVILVAFIIGSIVAILLCIIFILNALAPKNAFRSQQEDLARQLGVKIEDYPVPDEFPVEYFYTTLQPGMTLDQVHSIVRGYEAVYNCSLEEEIYYYFSLSDDKALRFMLTYDNQGRYIKFQAEDSNSRTLSLDSSCTQGVLTIR